MKYPTIKDRLAARQEPQNKLTVMHQDWRDLLFLHWEIDPLVILSTLPPGLYVDSFKDKAYIGLTPFALKNLRLSILPPIPGLSDFPEINVRTYVFDENGIPGIWFYSLDAANPAAVEAAKLINLPYRHSIIEFEKNSSNSIINVKLDTETDDLKVSSKFSYRMNGLEHFAESDSLEFFLIERYYLFTYSQSQNKLSNVQVHHSPYPLAPADLYSFDTNLITLDSFSKIIRPPDHIIMSPGVDVKIYNIE